MENTAGSSLALLVRDTPRLRRRGNQHLPSRRPNLAEGIPVDRCRRTASGPLRTKLRLIEVGLLKLHIVPVDVEFLGHQHWEHCLDALPPFGVLGRNRHRAVGGDANEGPRHKGRGRARWLSEHLGHRAHVATEQHPAASQTGHAKKTAPVDK